MVLMHHILVADEVWLAMALLHREQPSRPDFSTREILERAERENLTGRLRPGIRAHVSRHCVANRPPSPDRYRMLYETGEGRRRLFRPGDRYDHRREGSKTLPDREAMPPSYRDLIDWYLTAYVPAVRASQKDDPILALRGIGKHLSSGEHPDEHVRRLREGWE